MNPIELENKLEGTELWVLKNPAKKREIEGFASMVSINCGESLSLFVSTNSNEYGYTVYRMGWYDGKGGRVVQEYKKVKGTLQNTPLPDIDTGLIECNWINPIELKSSKNWISGIYIVKLIELSNNKESYILFVVRNDEIPADISFQLPVTTYQAYNFWGGKSLYDWGSGSIQLWGHKYGKRASRVSFNRPYVCSTNDKAAYGVGAGEFFTNIQPVNTQYYPISSASWDYNMVRWLEKNNYHVTYISNIDTHGNPSVLKNSKVFLSNGHDEYWSTEMRTNVENLKTDGIHLAFFSANSIFWQIRFATSDITKQPYRTIVCYKDSEQDVINDHTCTVNFRDNIINNPESKLLGVQHFIDPIDGDITISNSDHPIFSNTNLKNGDSLEGLLGYEVDQVTPFSPKNIEVLTKSIAKNKIANNYLMVIKMLWHKILVKLHHSIIRSNINHIKTINIVVKTTLALLILLFFSFIYFSSKTYYLIFPILFIISVLYFSRRKMIALNQTIVKEGTSNMTIYKTSKGTYVFASGTIQWSWGLDNYNAPKLRTSRKSENAQIITKNVFKIMGV